jgi:Pyruvate/2-oxoacid:ferredoxin oxidoreductase delta subunit
MKAVRKIIEIDESKCDGCGLCVPSCAEGAIKIENGKARLVAEKYCDGLGACLGECPQDALCIVEREVDEYDEQAVHEHLQSQVTAKEPAMACGCPSSLIQTFAPLKKQPKQQAPGPVQEASALTHWPIQIRLVPPTAPFLKNADLLVAADCAPAAYPGFHRLLEGKVLLIGCPKFDNAEEYIRKFELIFRNNDIRSVTVFVMEVPCCQGLPPIVAQAMKLAGKNTPLKKTITGINGEMRLD